MLCENDHLADVVPDYIFISLPREEAGKSCYGDVINDVIPVNTPDSCRDGFIVQIGRKNLDIPADAKFFHGFLEQNCDGICLFTGGTACYPDADLLFFRRVLDQLFDGGFFENIKVFRIAEKAGHTDQDFLGEQLGFFRIVGQICNIFLQIPVVRDNQTAFHAPQDRRLLVLRVGLLNQIRESCRNRVARHTVKFGRFRTLYDDHSVVFFD